jgi:DNA-binding transcriptional ArsR family regulator
MTVKTLIPDDFELRFQRAFGLLAFSANRHLIDHMRRIVIDLDMDPETALIWGTLAHMNNLPQLPLGADPMTVLNEIGMKKDTQIHPMRLAELAQITGLPRETVRRKLTQLQTLGKVERTETGKWIYLSAGVGEKEREFTRLTILKLLRTAQTLASILEQVDPGSTLPEDTPNAYQKP